MSIAEALIGLSYLIILGIAGAISIMWWADE